MYQGQALPENDTKVLLALTNREREELNFYAEMGMPANGNVVGAIRRVVHTQRLWVGKSNRKGG